MFSLMISLMGGDWRCKIVQIMRFPSKAYNNVVSQCETMLYPELTEMMIHVNAVDPCPFAQGNVSQQGAESNLLGL